jgi:hypothetical protein
VPTTTKTRLTEADLDARELERISAPMPRGCTGACSQGHCACDCAGARPVTWRDIGRTLARPFAIAWLRWEISSHEQWIADATRVGILGTNNLIYCDRELQRLRVSLALWEAA